MKNYMSVKELKNEYLEQLKFKIYYMSYDELKEEFGDLVTDEIVEELANAIYINDIKDEIIYTLFNGISFVDEDFGGIK